jgi:hypothetical protein
MQEPISQERYDKLVAYLIQSTDAMDATFRALEPYPLHSSQVFLLNESLDSARVLLSEVLIHQFNPPRSHLLSIVKENREKKSFPEQRRRR